MQTGAVRITARSAGFRRGGIAHPTEPTLYAADFFTDDQLEAMRQERELIVEDADVAEATAASLVVEPPPEPKAEQTNDANTSGNSGGEGQPAVEGAADKTADSTASASPASTPGDSTAGHTPPATPKPAPSRGGRR